MVGHQANLNTRHAPPSSVRSVLSDLGGGLLGGRYGEAPAQVVALHGWRRTHTDFDRVLEGLAAVAPDLPGFGAGAEPPEAWGAAGYAEAVVAACPADPVVVVGHSFGGRVALLLAARYPGRVRALVLTGVPLFRPAGSRPPTPGLGHRVARTLHRVGVLSDDRMEARRRRSGSEDYRQASGTMRAVLVRAISETDDGTYRRALVGLRCPVELVWGEGDTAASVAVAREAAELVAGSRLTVLPGVGHLTPTEAPAALRAAVLRHLAGAT